MTAGQPSIRVTVQLTPIDFYRYWLGASLRRYWWFAGIMILSATWFVASISTGTIQWTWTLQNVLGPGFVFLIFPYIFFISPYFRAQKYFDKNPHISEPRTLIISSQGIEFSSAHSQSNVDWQGIPKAQEISKYFLLYPQTAFAYIIPKRCLLAPTDESGLRELIRGHVKEARLRS